jgi:hypothetical protein
MSMPNSLVKHLQDRIADAKHDIESIEMHLVKQNESSISADQVQGLRGLQKMYRKRIVKLDAEIATVPNQDRTTREACKDLCTPAWDPLKSLL